MDNRNKDQLFQYFKDTIQTESGVQIDSLKAEIADLRNQAEQAFEKELKEQQSVELGNAKNDAARQYQTRLTEAHHQLDLDVKDKRQQLLDSVFEGLNQRLLAYRQSAEYRAWLDQKLAGLSLDEFSAIEIDSEDQILLARKGLPPVKQVAGLVAGFILHAKDGKTLIDASFKTKIAAAKEWFYDHAAWFTEKEDAQ